VPGATAIGGYCFRTISNLVRRPDRSSCFPGKKAGVEAKKGREKPSKFSVIRFHEETRWQRDNKAETAEARIWKRGTTAFFGEANDFLPGHGSTGQYLVFSIGRTRWKL
jgi:hypothetical protein